MWWVVLLSIVAVAAQRIGKECVKDALAEQMMLEHIRPILDSYVTESLERNENRLIGLCEKRISRFEIQNIQSPENVTQRLNNVTKQLELNKRLYEENVQNLTNVTQRLNNVTKQLKLNKGIYEENVQNLANVTQRLNNVTKQLELNKELYEENIQRLDTMTQKLDDFTQRIEVINFHMDGTAVNRELFLSRNRMSMFNTNAINFTAVFGNGDVPYDWPPLIINNRNFTYWGARSSTSARTPNVLCYEVDIFYTFRRISGNFWNIFEIGLTRRDTLYSAHSFEYNSKSWSFSVQKTPDSLKRRCKAGPDFTNNHTIDTITTGTIGKMYLGVRINTLDRSMIVVDRVTNEVFCNFTDIDFTEELWPTFGIIKGYDLPDVRLTIKRGFILTSSQHWFSV